MSDPLRMIAPGVGFRHYMYFNRFAVEEDGGFVLIHFGTVLRGLLTGTFSAAISKVARAALRKPILDYLGGQGTIGDPPPDWPAPQVSTLEIADVILMSRHSDMADTAIFATSLGAAIETARRVMEERKSNPET